MTLGELLLAGQELRRRSQLVFDDIVVLEEALRRHLPDGTDARASAALPCKPMPPVRPASKRMSRAGARAMTFQCDGESHDTAGMYRFDTGSPHEPVVFVTRDHASVFVQTMSRDVGVRVHRANLAEVRRLWRAHACSELARVLGVEGVVAVIAVPGEHQPPRR
jgi:hypothetical protein